MKVWDADAPRIINQGKLRVITNTKRTWYGEDLATHTHVESERSVLQESMVNFTMGRWYGGDYPLGPPPVTRSVKMRRTDRDACLCYTDKTLNFWGQELDTWAYSYGLKRHNRDSPVRVGGHIENDGDLQHRIIRHIEEMYEHHPLSIQAKGDRYEALKKLGARFSIHRAELFCKEGVSNERFAHHILDRLTCQAEDKKAYDLDKWATRHFGVIRQKDERDGLFRARLMDYVAKNCLP